MFKYISFLYLLYLIMFYYGDHSIVFPIFSSDDDQWDNDQQPILPKVWQNRALTAILIVICNMHKLPSKRYLKSEKFTISVHIYNQNKNSKSYATQYLTKKTCDVTRGQSLTFFITSDPQFSFKFWTDRQLISHFCSPLADGLVAAVQLIIILILSTWAWARAFHLKSLFTFYCLFRAKLAFVD